VRITKIVVDFMTDFQGETWLINAKAIWMEPTKPMKGLEVKIQSKNKYLRDLMGKTPLTHSHVQFIANFVEKFSREMMPIKL
jgi:hypothetical protein